MGRAGAAGGASHCSVHVLAQRQSSDPTSTSASRCRRPVQVEGLKLREAAADSPTRQLAAGGGQALSLRSTPQALVLLARRHGWRCLYAGLHINYLKVVPSTAIGAPACLPDGSCCCFCASQQLACRAAGQPGC